MFGAAGIMGEKKPVDFVSAGFYEECCKSSHPRDLEGLAHVIVVLWLNVFIVLASDVVDDQLRQCGKRDNEPN
jgi:hypothetical protein